MSLIPRINDQQRASEPISWQGLEDGWLASNRSRSGVSVNATTAAGLDAVSAVLGLFSDVLSMLPVDVFEDVDGTPQIVGHPVPLVATPSVKVDARTWRAQVVVSWLLWGNAYGYVTAFDDMGFPIGVEWLHPDSVEVIEDGALSIPRYKVDGRSVPNERIIHRPGKWVMPGSCVGVAPLTRFRETIGLALAARDFAAGWFGDGAHPSAVLETDQAPDQTAIKTIKSRLMAAIRNHEPLVLGHGTKWRSVQSTPGDSQMTEQQAAAAVSVARAFGVQPEMIAAQVSGSSVTYANREQRAIDFLTFSADPWLVRFEDMLSENLPNREYAKFNRGALLRTDITTRYKAHSQALRDGWKNRDEVRALEDQGPIPGGDLYLMPAGRAVAVSDDGSPSADDQAAQARDVAELIQKIYLGVGVIVSADEAREIANRAGADLTGPLALPQPATEGGDDV